MRSTSKVESVFCDVCGKRLTGGSHSHYTYYGSEIYVDFKAEVFFKREFPGQSEVPDICEECADRLMKNMKR